MFVNKDKEEIKKDKEPVVKNPNLDENESDDDSVEEKELTELDLLMLIKPKDSLIYKGKLITINDMSNEYLLEKTLNILGNDFYTSADVNGYDSTVDSDNFATEEEFKQVSKQECEKQSGMYVGDMCFMAGTELGTAPGFKEETVIKYYEQFYGNEVPYKRITKLPKPWKFYNEHYLPEMWGYGENYDVTGDVECTNFIKEEDNGDDKYIYISYLHLNTIIKSNDEYYYEVYSDMAEKNKLGESHDIDNCCSTVFSEYGDKVVTYKHTYKKNTDGTYRWYSIEVVDNI